MYSEVACNRQVTNATWCMYMKVIHFLNTYLYILIIPIEYIINKIQICNL